MAVDGKFNLALTYHDPGFKFGFLLFEALEEAKRRLKPSRIFVHVSTATRIQNPDLYNFLKVSDMAKFISTKEGTEANPRLDFHSLATQLGQLDEGRPTVYFDADTFAMSMVIYQLETERWVQAALGEISREGSTVDIAFLQRSRQAMETYPPEQRLTEPVLNKLIAYVAELERCTDFAAGVFAMSPEAVHEWAEEAAHKLYWIKTSEEKGVNLQQMVLSAALYKEDPSSRVVGIEDSRGVLGSYETRWVSDINRPRDQREMSGYYAREANRPIDQEVFRGRCETVMEWMRLVSAHSHVKNWVDKGVPRMERTLLNVINGGDPEGGWMKLVNEGYFEGMMESYRVEKERGHILGTERFVV